MAGLTFPGHRKGWPGSLQGGDWEDTGATCAASAWACTAGWRWCICWVHAVKIPESPARERQEQTDSTSAPRQGQGTAGRAPSHTLQVSPITTVDTQPISSHMKNETWAKNEDTFLRSEGARGCPSYFMFAFSKRHSCSFSPMSLFTTAGFTYADPWMNFKELYYWSQQ